MCYRSSTQTDVGLIFINLSLLPLLVITDLPSTIKKDFLPSRKDYDSTKTGSNTIRALMYVWNRL